ncbi:hypothetical protein AAGG49_22685, partial [Stenotrophomonas maltophilia]|uniref:hypothetical protein n=1 Tax=Stenotrophomonas maltophilia TaxID=40324 RepID=UPI00313BDA96
MVYIYLDKLFVGGGFVPFFVHFGELFFGGFACVFFRGLLGGGVFSLAAWWGGLPGGGGSDIII